jgi:hypothetical protein
VLALQLQCWALNYFNAASQGDERFGSILRQANRQWAWKLASEDFLNPNFGRHYGQNHRQGRDFPKGNIEDKRAL